MFKNVSLSEAVAIFEKAYDILVEHAGAKWFDKYDFVSLETMVETFPSKEYRFCGNLGFGGKFWNNDSLYVSSTLRSGHALIALGY